MALGWWGSLSMLRITSRLLYTLGGQIGALSMKWFLPALAVVVFLVGDRVYADGRGADELFSIVRRVGSSIAHWSDELLRPLRE